MKSLVILLIALSFNAYSQVKTIKGEIIDKNSKSHLPFANVGILNKNAGTVSDSSGRFHLKLNEGINENDYVTFSYIGYQPLTMKVSQLLAASVVIELEPTTNQLAEVVVKFSKPKQKVLGRSGKGLGLMHYNFYTAYEKGVDDRLSKEIGMKFKIKSDCKLNDLNIHITSNQFSSLKFRLNIYKVENGVPTALVINKDVVFEVKDQFLGWHRVDLRPYEIYLDKEIGEVAITIQWVESTKANENSKYFGISSTSSPTETCFHREKSMDTWKKSAQSLSFYLNTLSE